jgi:AAA domain
MNIKGKVMDAEVPPHPLPESHWFGQASIDPPPALVKGIFPETGLAGILGQSGGGKTFQALHLGVRLIPDCQQDYYIDRYRIKRKGGVLYFALEGKSAFPMRVSAAFEDVLGKQMKLGDKAKLPFAWNFYEPRIFTDGADNMIKLVEREAKRMRAEFGVDLVAIFLDTIGLAARYESEDKAAQVQQVLSDLKYLGESTGSLVIPVDHMGKDQEMGARGSSAKRDIPDTLLACLGDKNADGVMSNLRMVLYKIRDGEAGRVIPFKLEVMPRGIDEDGDPITTCVVKWEPNRAPPEKPKRERPKTDGALAKAIEEVGLPADAAVLRKVFYEHHGGDRHTANAAWNRVVKNLAVTKEGKLDWPVSVF